LSKGIEKAMKFLKPGFEGPPNIMNLLNSKSGRVIGILLLWIRILYELNRRLKYGT
jgi:hypothetical protein